MASEGQGVARAGLQASVPVFLPTLAIGVTFGLLATPILGSWPRLLMSALVWSGTSLHPADDMACLPGAAPAPEVLTTGRPHEQGVQGRELVW